MVSIAAHKILTCLAASKLGGVVFITYDSAYFEPRFLFMLAVALVHRQCLVSNGIGISTFDSIAREATVHKKYCPYLNFT